MPNKKALKIVQINTVPNGSTGSIMMSIHRQLLKDGYDSYAVWGRGRKAENDHEIYMNDKLGVYFHVLYSRLTGKTGFASKKATKKLLKKLDEIKPDIIHLHNLHGYYINIELLFNYIRKNNIKTVWTLHDCWTFTGHCTNFESTNCQCWKGKKCISIKSYPKSIINKSEQCYIKKKSIFTIKNMTIVTPSKWLAGIVEQSFLKENDLKIIYNGIDTNIFKVTNSDFRDKYNLNNKTIILGVANVWTKNKGIEDYIQLAKILNKQYKIVLVGKIKKNYKKKLNNTIILNQVKDKKELAKIYNGADIYYNPSREETFGMTNIEALSCEKPVIAYNTTATPEILGRFKCAETCEIGNIEKVHKIIQQLGSNNYNFVQDNQIRKIFSINYCVKEYLKLYEEVDKE